MKYYYSLVVGTVSHSRRLIRLQPLLCLALGCFPAVRSVLVLLALFSAVWSLVCFVLVLCLFSAVSLCRLIVIKLQFLFPFSSIKRQFFLVGFLFLCLPVAWIRSGFSRLVCFRRIRSGPLVLVVCPGASLLCCPSAFCSFDVCRPFVRLCCRLAVCFLWQSDGLPFSSCRCRWQALPSFACLVLLCLYSLYITISIQVYQEAFSR